MHFVHIEEKKTKVVYDSWTLFTIWHYISHLCYVSQLKLYAYIVMIARYAGRLRRGGGWFRDLQTGRIYIIELYSVIMSCIWFLRNYDIVFNLTNTYIGAYHHEIRYVCNELCLFILILFTEPMWWLHHEPASSQGSIVPNSLALVDKVSLKPYWRPFCVSFQKERIEKSALSL